MKKDIRLALLFAFFILGALKSNAQPQRYLIKFKHKGTSPFSLATPANYLSARSIARRTRHDIVFDSTDLPVTPRFLDSIRSVPGVTVLNVSKWLNQVSIRTTDPATAIAAINRFTFVLSATSIAARTERGARVRSSGKQEANIKAPASPQIINQTAADFYNYGASYNQVHIHNGEFLHNIGLRGQNMIVGMMDAGFKNYLTVKAFDSARTNGQIFGTYDFVANEVSVNEDDAHGMQCFSTIAANIPGQFVGTAPKAGFYLYRTEESGTEYPIEEFNWVCGAERIDSAGGDLISSSVGYYDFDAPFNTPVYNHTYADMNGNTTTVAIGADLAAKKGILVVNSAGNEGNDPWRYIITPADGDSVLAVGAVNTSGIAANFSSYGPSSDGQVKPDVASVGVSTVVQFSGNTVGTSNGTSFSAPNMAGLATCLWQGFPEYNNMKIINALRQSGSIFTAPNDRIGYGIPDVKKALVQLTKEFSTSTGSVANCKTALGWTSKDMTSMKYEIERKAPGETIFKKIGERAGSGSVFATRNHQFTDSLINQQAGSFEYRIHHFMDTTLGADYYLNTITLNLSSACVPPVVPVAENGVVLMPNPASNLISLKITTPAAVQNLRIQISDAQGKRVAVQSKSKGAGTVTLPVSISGLSRGKYFVSVYADGVLMATKELLKL